MKNVITMFAIVLVSCSCSKDNNTGSEFQQGYATGHIQDAKGRPIKGATVVANNTLIGNNNPAGVTDDNGNYRIKLPVVGTYHTSATIQKEFNGKTYRLHLRPNTEDEFSNEGAVRNFEWRLSGKMEHEEEGYYGATMVINTEIGSQIIDNSQVEFKLVPQGKLIDGSDGVTLTMKGGLPFTTDYGAVKDIPLGRYLVTAIFKSGNGNVPVKLRNLFSYDDPYTSSLIVNFEPTTLDGDNVAQIICMEQ